METQVNQNNSFARRPQVYGDVLRLRRRLLTTLAYPLLYTYIYIYIHIYICTY